ncbi:hypothetical protein N8D55_18040 [Xanthomonas hortorum pv. pelargonii]|nr:hypothetical protein N8D55_18040 [Xanthomonas hortorum pv. pelargonii]
MRVGDVRTAMPPHLAQHPDRHDCARCSAVPATPVLLLVTAAIVPATWVPCQLELEAAMPVPHSIGGTPVAFVGRHCCRGRCCRARALASLTKS